MATQNSATSGSASRPNQRKYHPKGCFCSIGRSQRTATATPMNSDTIVAVKDIEAAFKRFDLKPEMVEEEGEECECTACDGFGEVQWTFTDDDGETYYMSGECPVCDGTGRAKKRRLVPTGRMLPPEEVMFVIDGVKFSARNIMKAVEGLRLLGCNQLRHIYTDVIDNNLFEVQDGIRILIVTRRGYEGLAKKVKTRKMEAEA